MLKRLGLPLVAVAAILSLNPKPADAKVHFGVYLGRPVYVAPGPDPYYYAPYTYDPYYAPYYDPYFVYPPVYSYGPAYVTPGYRGFAGRGFGQHHEFHGGARNFAAGQPRPSCWRSRAPLVLTGGARS
jgi:hypothetical protein